MDARDETRIRTPGADPGAPRRVPAWWPLAVLLVVAAGTVAVAASVAARLGAVPAPLADVAAGLAAAALLALAGVPATARHRRSRRAGIEAVDAMSGAEFEARLASLFGAQGAEVTALGGPGDYGADLVVARDGTRTVVQAKRYVAPVGIDAVQQVMGARRYHRADAAMVVTNSTYTRAAVALAAAGEVDLVARDRLTALLAADAAASRAEGALGLLGRQWLAGARLVLFAVAGALRILAGVLGRAARLAWWCARLPWRWAGSRR